MVLPGPHSGRERDWIWQTGRRCLLASNSRPRAPKEKLVSLFHGRQWLRRQYDYYDFVAVAVRTVGETVE